MSQSVAVTVRPKQVPDILKALFKVNLTPMLHSSPGVGKSDLVHQLADEYKLDLIDMRLSQMDPTDLNGFPSRNAAGTRSVYLPPEDMPLSIDKLKKGYDGSILFLDEITSSPPAIQAAAYKLILDRKVGKYDLHPNCYVIAAGNLMTDKAITHTMSTALQSRMAHISLVSHIDDWMHWAYTNKIDARITSYLASNSPALHEFDPAHHDNTFPCPRTWEFVSRLTPEISNITMAHLPIIASVIGRAAAEQFIIYNKVYAHLPKFEDILAAPDNIAIPSEPAARYAIAGTLGERMNPKNIDKVFPFLDRLPIEWQVISMSRTLSEHKLDLMRNANVRKWVSKNSTDLMPNQQGI